MHVTIRFFSDANNIQELAESIVKEIPGVRLKSILQATRIALLDVDNDAAVKLLKKNKFLEYVKCPRDII